MNRKFTALTLCMAVSAALSIAAAPSTWAAVALVEREVLNGAAAASADAPRSETSTFEFHSNEVFVAQGDEHPAIKHHEKFSFADMPDVGAIVNNAMAGAFSYSFDLSGGHGKSIKNAPYSAEVINEKVQNLPDGNQITRKNVTRVYRDNQGSTRQEVVETNGETKSVHIKDSEGNRYILMPAKKSAVKIMGSHAFAPLHGSDDGKKLLIKKRAGGGYLIEKPDQTTGAKNVHEEISIKVIRAGDSGSASSMAEMHDAFTHVWRMGEPVFMSKDKGYAKTTTNLGFRDFDGVRAEGKSTGYTIPAGKIGNKNPIIVTSETWYSPELQITVYSKHSDPRVGDTIYRLQNLKRAEPAANLFEVPADYTVKDTLTDIKNSIKVLNIEKHEKHEKQ